MRSQHSFGFHQTRTSARPYEPTALLFGAFGLMNGVKLVELHALFARHRDPHASLGDGAMNVELAVA